MNYQTEYPSPVGRLTLCSDGVSLVGLWIEGQKYFGAGAAGKPAPGAGLPVLELARGWLDRYFAGEDPNPALLPLAPAGSGFRQAVWRQLLQIPRGQVVTYGELARQLTSQSGQAVSPRAVGGAVGHNPVSIIIPCHRVIGAGGSLTGYAGGVEKKRWLLRHEGINTATLR